MKVKLEIPYPSFLLFEDLNDVGPLFKAIASARVCKEEGYGKDRKVIEADPECVPTLQIVPSTYDVAKTDLQQVLLDRVQASENRWLEQYNETNKLKEELKAANAKLAKHEAISAD